MSRQFSGQVTRDELSRLTVSDLLGEESGTSQQEWSLPSKEAGKVSKLYESTQKAWESLATTLVQVVRSEKLSCSEDLLFSTPLSSFVRDARHQQLHSAEQLSCCAMSKAHT